MRVGVIGAGRIGMGFATHVVGAGHDVVLSNSRGPESLASAAEALGEHAHAGTLEEAAAQPIVLLSAPWSTLPAVLGGLPPWNGRILIDATNRWHVAADGSLTPDVDGPPSSVVVSGLAPGARVVKAFNTVPAELLAGDPKVAGGARVVFLSGDDPEARAEVVGLVKEMGFAPIALGDLAAGSAMQQVGGPLAGPNLVRVS